MTAASDSVNYAGDRCWWTPDVLSEERYIKLRSTVDQMRAQQVKRRDTDLGKLRMYSSSEFAGLGVNVPPRLSSTRGARVSFNVIKNCSDAFVAKVTKDRPKIAFVTEGGDWSLQQKALSLSKFVEGQFYESVVYDMGPNVVRDGGGIFGKGFFKVYKTGKKKKARIKVDRVLPFELLVDEREGFYGEAETPRIYQEKWVDRKRLLADFAGDAELVAKIRVCSSGSEEKTGVGYDPFADQVLVTEGWSKPTSPGAKDGRHVMCVNNATLSDEEWRYDWFPFFSYAKQDDVVGFWGISLADELDGIQREINVLLAKIKDAMHLLGAAHVLVHSTAKVNFAKWDNQQGSKIQWSGNVEPKVIVPPELVSPEVYTHLDRLYNRGYEITGIPQPQAQGSIPSNLESGKAQEVYLDVTDQRMQVAIHNYHALFLKMARAFVELGRDIVANDNQEYAVKANVGRGTMKRIFLSEVDLADDEYIMKLWPENALSDDPVKRAQVVEKWADAGWITPDDAKRLMNLPDLEEAANLENASYNAVEDAIEGMLEDGEYLAPIPFLNLEQAKIQVTRAIVKAWKQKRPQDRQQLLRDFMEDLMALPGGPNAPAAPQTMAGAGGTPVAAAPAPGVTPAMMGGGGPPPGAPPPVAPPMAA